MSRLGRRVLIGVLALVLVIGALFVFTFHTGAGLRAVLNVAVPMIPGELQYQSIDGSLAGPIRARSVTYEISGTRVRAGELNFNFSPGALLSGRVAVSSLDATGVEVSLAAEDDEAAKQQPFQPAKLMQALSLPVELVIDNVDLRNVTLRTADGSTLLALERLKLGALEWGERELAVRTLDADGPLLSASGDAVIGLAQGMHTDLALDVRWQDQPFPLAGTISASGTPARLSVSAALSEPATAALDATLTNLLDAPHWQGTLDVQPVALSAFDNSLPSAHWSAKLNFNGGWQSTDVEGSARGAWPPLGDIDARFDGRVTPQTLALQQLDAAVAGLDMQLDARATLHYGEALRYTAKGRFDRLSWPGMEAFALREGTFDIAGDPAHVQGTLQAGAKDGQLLASGEYMPDSQRFDVELEGSQLEFRFNDQPVEVLALDASASGTPQDYSVSGETRIDIGQLPPLHVIASAGGGSEGLTADITKLEWLGGSASGNVAVAWQPALQLDAKLNAQGFRLDALDPRLAGTVGGEFSVQADLAGKQPNVAVRIDSLDGNIDGLELDGKGSVRYADGRLGTDGLTVEAGGAQLALDGSRERGFDFRLDAPALARFHPDLAGEIRASGHIEGELAAPTLSIDAQGSNLAWQQWRAGTLSLDAEIQNGGQAPSKLHLDTGGVETPFIAAGELTLDASGQLGEHDVELVVQGAGNDGQGSLRFAAEGGLVDSAWQGDIDALRFEHPLTGPWSLAQADATKTIAVGADTLSFPEHCLEGPQGQACLGPASGDFANLSLEGKLDRVPVGMLAGLLPAGLEYEGTISGRINVQPAAQGLQGALRFTLTEGGIRQVIGEGHETLLGWESGEATVNLAGDTARGELSIALTDGGQVTGSGTLDMPPDGRMTVDANLAARIDNLQLLPSLVPELSRVRGRLTADLNVQGPLQQPRVFGRAQLHDGSARILALGTDWENVTFTLNAEGREISGEGRVESGDGFIDINLGGRDTGEGFVGKASIEGQDFKAVQTPEANVDISPALGLELKGRDLFIDGEVFVPMARIEPRDLATATQVSEDQVIVNAERDAETNGLRVHAAVTTRLGDNVRLDGFGLTARLEGRLTVAQQPGNPPIGNGKLTVAEGQYKAYGQDLTLAKGEIIYTGQPITNPGLDIRAERQPNPDTMVGVSVRGPLSNPTTSIYSDPAMSETAALSLLLFGRNIEDTSGTESAQLNEASIALGLGGGKLLQNVGERLGVEEVSVQDIGNRERASLVLGKYLSPDLYVSYGIGLFEAVNTFRMRYRLSRRWTVEATSGLQNSADFIYTIER